MSEHKSLIDDYNADYEADRDNREDGLDDLRFQAGDQWDQSARSDRELFKRPIITINRMGQFVRQVTGDMRLNPISINVVPVDDYSDVDKAEILEGIIRQIEYQSGASNVYAHAFECSAGVGIGHFRIKTQYVQDTVDDQEILIDRILNPFAVVWDGAATKIDRSDASRCFVTELMPVHAFKKRFKGAAQSDFPTVSDISNLYWRTGDMVRVAEVWKKVPYQRTLALTTDGDTIDITGLTKAQRTFLNLAVGQDDKPRMRTFEDTKVQQAMISGSDMLTDWNDWAGRHIPIIPAIGCELPLDEKVVRHGIIRWAKDPQRLYNYYRSSQAELIGQQPRAPFLLTPEMIKGHESQWNTANTNPRPWLPYNPDPKAPSGKPERQQPPTASAALWQEAALCADDMKATTGIYDASLGAKSNETSGKAIMARQREGDVGSYVYFDNFKMAMKRAGTILLDLIPKIYDTERVIRIIGAESDEPRFERINVQTIDGVLNDLSVGRFDARIQTGPSFSTRREESREVMMEMTRANGNMWNIAGDLLVEAFDFPKAKEIAERIRKTMPPQLLAEEGAPQQPDELQQIAMRMNFAKQEAEIEKTKAQTEKLQVETEQAVIDTVSGGNPHL